MVDGGHSGNGAETMAEAECPLHPEEFADECERCEMYEEEVSS